MEKVLEELDNQETHIRRLARRIDLGSDPCQRVELRVASEMFKGLQWLHDEEDRVKSTPSGLVDPASMVVGRAKSQALAIVVLARHVEQFGAPISADAIRTELDRARERMPFRMEITLNDAPDAVDRDKMKRDFFELIFNPQQEALLQIDEALDEVIRRSRES